MVLPFKTESSLVKLFAQPSYFQGSYKENYAFLVKFFLDHYKEING